MTPGKESYWLLYLELQSTVHTTLGAKPMQVVFGWDAILNLSHEANWQLIKLQKQELINKNNKIENQKRVHYAYTPSELVLLKNKWTTKFGKDTYQGPWEITSVNNNRTLSIKKGIITDKVNIQNVHPYNSSEDWSL